MEHDEDFKRSPAWKQALADLRAMNVGPDHVLTQEWLDTAFGCRPNVPMNRRERSRERVAFVDQFEAMRRAMLEEDRLMLRPVREGYIVIRPEDQTGRALRDLGAEMRKRMNKAAREVSHVRHEALTTDQMRANVEAQAKLGALAGMLRPQLRRLGN